MELQLITTKDSPDTINKTLTILKTIQVRLKADFDIIRPNIILDISVDDASKYNYAYFPELKRYYFIDRTENINNRLWRFYLSCDVLETYKNKVIPSYATFTRDIMEGDYSPPTATSARKEPVTVTSDVALGSTPSILVATIVTKE